MMNAVPWWFYLIGAMAFGAVTAAVLVLVVWVSQIGRAVHVINAKLGCGDRERLKRHSDQIDDLTTRVEVLEKTAGAIEKINSALERRNRIKGEAGTRANG